MREVRSGIPFVGKSGKILDQVCNHAGVPRGRLAILNACACGPIPSHADAMKAASVAACRPRLLNELRRLRPDVILALGGQALKSLAPQLPSGVTALRGALLEAASDVCAYGGDGVARLPDLALDVSATRFAHLEVDDGTPTPRPATLVDLDLRPSWRPALMASLHPAHILRGADPESPAEDERSSSVDVLYFFLLYDLAKAWRYAHGEISPWRDTGDFFVWSGRLHRVDVERDTRKATVGAPAPAGALIRAIERIAAAARAEGIFGYDVETDGRDPLKAGLTAIGFGTVGDSLSATWAAWQGVPEALAIARELLADRSVHKIAHNGLFDRPVLRRHGLPVAHPTDDSMLMHHCAFPGLPHRLDQVAAQFTLSRPWKTEFKTSLKDPASLVLYNAADARGTLLLRKPIADMLAKHRTELPYEVDRQLAGVAIAMREAGYFVDPKERARQSTVQHARLDYMRAELAADFERIAPAWREALARQLATRMRKGDPESYLDRLALRYRQIAEREPSATDVGLLKPKAKADLVALFEALRIHALSYTRTGLPVTDKSAMEDAAARHPLMRKLIHLREAQHLLATYIDGLPLRADGRVHPDWSITKITGRWSAGKSQNWPKLVPGWPPETRADGSWKRKPIMDVSGKTQRRDERGEPLWGDLSCTHENPRALIAAPTALEILALGLEPGAHVHPQVLARALEG
ncbi:MAG: uracil-DNA glycosylase family protein, partial [Dehalococcoidia bacterium]|nr:uracil-DNA glycosylase family protein [Dehalococcoidia bacterium]